MGSLLGREGIRSPMGGERRRPPTTHYAIAMVVLACIGGLITVGSYIHNAPLRSSNLEQAEAKVVSVDRNRRSYDRIQAVFRTRRFGVRLPLPRA